MINLPHYLQHWLMSFAVDEPPWQITTRAADIVESKLKTLNDEFTINGLIAIHKTAVVDDHVVLKGPIIISANCFVGAHAYLRGGVFLDTNVSVGPGCEVKSSFILRHSALAHFNFIGDSILGSYVNMEAGSIIANHYNERQEKMIKVMMDGKIIKTDSEKFGALIGDYSKIGANAVLSPGTILEPKSIVKRLELVEQIRKE
jgi:NDP-sugar pyrophosphorylase family protein